MWFVPALCGLAALLSWAGPAAADETYTKCIDDNSTNPAWADCGQAYLDRLDGALNAAWKKVNAPLDEQSRKDLLAEQRAWITYRDASCRMWANGSFGREGQVLSFYGCRADVIEARIAALNGMYGQMHQDQP